MESLQVLLFGSGYSLLAFDLLVDHTGAVWLLEVNSKPALHAQSASLKDRRSS